MDSWTDPLKKALLIAGAALAILAPSAGAATVVNGDFESDNLTGWQQYQQFPSGEWFTYDKADAEASSFFPPPFGNFAATNDQGDPNYEALYQDISLEPYFTHQLELTYYYVSTREIVVPNPETLALGPEMNQHVRVDVIKPSAPLDTVAPGDILATLYVSKNGDPEVLAPTRLTADLTPFAGQTVRLRVATSVTLGPINSGLDGVTITSTPPSNVISRGKLTLNKAKGTGQLAVNVPGPGTLLEIAKGKKKKIKRTELVTTGAGTVQLQLKPTSVGRKILNAKGKLKTRVDVFFTPTGGTASVQTYKVTLKKTLKK
jgi:hypothetical protein